MMKSGFITSDFFLMFGCSGIDIEAATSDPAISAALAAVASTAYQLPKVNWIDPE